MERRLIEAALSGNETTLDALIHEDPLILDRVSLTCFNDTPLHVAALHGNLVFVKAVLILKPQFVTALDSFGRSPLHLACAEGHVEIVKTLFQACPQQSQKRDQDGRISLDLAALNDRVEVLAYLLREKPEPATSDSMETTLHLCVRYNSIGALKLLMDHMGKDKVVKCVDEGGNTLLHLAVIHQQIETVKYLLGRQGFDENWNSLNKSGFTAIDVLDHCPRDWRSLEIQDILMKAGVRRAKDLHNQPKTSSVTSSPGNPIVPPTSQCGKVRKFFLKIWNNYIRNESDWAEKTRGNLMVVAALTANISFQAGINPPGGVWQETTDKHKSGNSIMSDNHQVYEPFMVANTISLIASTSIIFLMISGIPLKTKVVVAALMSAMCISILCICYAYFIAIVNVLTPERFQTADDLYNPLVLAGLAVVVWVILIGIILLTHCIRFVVWLTRLMKKLWRFVNGRCLKGSRNEINIPANLPA